MLVIALGQNAVDTTLAIPLGILLTKVEGEEAPPLKRTGVLRLARPELPLMRVEGTLDIDAITPCGEGMKVEKLPAIHKELSVPGTRCLIDLNGQ